MVRFGEYKDVPVLVSLLEEAHMNSVYKEYETDKGVIRQLLVGAIQRATVMGEQGTCVYVWDDEGVQGFIIGIRDRIYHIAKDFRASDIFFYISSAYNDPMAFRMLLKSFEDWAWSHPRVKKIDLGITNIIGDPQRLAVIYRRFGYTESGVMVEKYRPEPF